jgi:hypothetical protein
MHDDGPPVIDLLTKLPWFRDLTEEHRSQMVAEITGTMRHTTTRDQYASLLEIWADVAHGDAKRARFSLLRESGLLAL